MGDPQRSKHLQLITVDYTTIPFTQKHLYTYIHTYNKIIFDILNTLLNTGL